MKEAKCFACLERPCEGYSAYCAECQPAPRPAPAGRLQCQCARCGEIFTTPRNFDMHQTMSEHTGLTCKDPRRMFDRNRRRRMVLTTRGWAKNPDLNNFNTFDRTNRG